MRVNGNPPFEERSHEEKDCDYYGYQIVKQKYSGQFNRTGLPVRPVTKESSLAGTPQDPQIHKQISETEDGDLLAQALLNEPQTGEMRPGHSRHTSIDRQTEDYEDDSHEEKQTSSRRLGDLCVARYFIGCGHPGR